MITLKAKVRIKDSKSGNIIMPNQLLEVSEKRLQEIRKNAKANFNNYFDIIEVKKKKK